MDFTNIQSWLGLLTGTVALFGTIFAGLWAYARYILERGMLPPVEFYPECKLVGVQADHKILEILLHIKNHGSAALVAKDVTVNIRYLEESDQHIECFKYPDPKYGRLKFPHTLGDTIQNSTENKGEKFLIAPHDTFVQTKIDQVYTFVTAVPAATRFVLIKGSFKYRNPKDPHKSFLNIGHSLGLVQIRAENIQQPHTTERVFNISQNEAA